MRGADHREQYNNKMSAEYDSRGNTMRGEVKHGKKPREKEKKQA